MSSMTPTQCSRQRRRAKARRLHESGMSVRAVARELHVAHTTVLTDLAAPAPEGQVLRPKRAPPACCSNRRLARRNALHEQHNLARAGQVVVELS